jgi:hypothetical protein
MAFQSGIQTSVDGVAGTALITDLSNYDAAAQNGAERADFTDFLMVRVERPVDGGIYEFATANAQTLDNDQIIDAPSEDTGNEYTVPSSFHVVNGSYTATVVAIPTYDATVGYFTDNLVYHNGSIYRAVQNVTGIEPGTNDLAWELKTVTEVIDGDIGTVYTSFKVYSVEFLTESTDPYATTMLDAQSVLQVSIGSNCDLITAVDGSNYGTNDENGHSLSDFDGYRRLIISNSGGVVAELNSLDNDDTTDEITPASTGNTALVWDMADNDNDGLYTIELCSVPSWKQEVYYNSMTASRKVIVWHNNQLWEATAANLNEEPGAEGSSNWTVFTGNLSDTRYCFDAKVVVTCRTIDLCYKTMVYEANCLSINCCEDEICDNPKLVGAMRMNLIMTELPWAVSNKDWSRVDSLVNAALNICCCS